MVKHKATEQYYAMKVLDKKEGCQTEADRTHTEWNNIIGSELSLPCKTGVFFWGQF